MHFFAITVTQTTPINLIKIVEIVTCLSSAWAYVHTHAMQNADTLFDGSSDGALRTMNEEREEGRQLLGSIYNFCVEGSVSKM